MPFGFGDVLDSTFKKIRHTSSSIGAIDIEVVESK